jgi:hypothetical protein
MDERELCWQDERLARFFDRLGKIRWFEFRREGKWTNEEEEQAVQRVAKAFGFDKKVILIVKGDADYVKRWVWAKKTDVLVPEWHEIQWNALLEIAAKMPYKLSRDLGYAIFEKIDSALPLSQRGDVDVEMKNDAIRTAIGAGFYEICDNNRVRKKYPTNPFGELMRFYEHGFWPTGKTGPTFYVWHPYGIVTQSTGERLKRQLLEEKE